MEKKFKIGKTYSSNSGQVLRNLVKIDKKSNTIFFKGVKGCELFAEDEDGLIPFDLSLKTTDLNDGFLIELK